MCEVSGWRSMDDGVPKDGTEVLGVFLGRRIIMKWANWINDDPAGAEWLGVNVVWHDGRGSITSLRDGLGRGGPTAWMPMPAPPPEAPQ